MYDILVYREDVGQFVPATKLGYESWNEAAAVMTNLTIENPGSQYRVEYRRMRKPRRKRGY